MVDMATICADLRAEQVALDVLLQRLNETDWDVPTPAAGWRVRDQISHIGATDRIATMAVRDPEGFKAAFLTPDRVARMAQQLEIGRTLRGHELLEWWRTGRAAMLAVFHDLEPKTRIVWFGPAMRAVSFVTARLMETWAHGQDIVDALGFSRPATERLHHIAHLGVRARPFSYRVHGKEPPAEEVYVELLSPAGIPWTWGVAQTHNRIHGSALDFCLVVTQRRHLADTDLGVEGPLAVEWMQIAQAFAGPPGAGRQPGQFPNPS